MKTALTPGRLYSKLSSEFRQVRCSKCRNCVLPLPYPVDQPTPGGGPSWMLGALSRECEDCTRAIAGIVRRHQAQYDLIDPITPPVKAPHPRATFRPTTTGPWTH